MNINTNHILEMLKKYLAIPSPGGYTEEAILEAKNDFKKFGLSTELTKKGALIGTIKGENDDEHVMITAHIDTLGAMVKEITDNGRLKY